MFFVCVLVVFEQLLGWKPSAVYGNTNLDTEFRPKQDGSAIHFNKTWSPSAYDEKSYG